MKKVKISGKLSLNKETVAKLNDSQMNRIIGGATKSIREVETKPVLITYCTSACNWLCVQESVLEVCSDACV